MNDDALLRYSRHILLNEWGVEAQRLIMAAHVLVVGAGGLGSPALLYLASAGVGKITLADGDAVDVSNLQRQIVHNVQRLGMNKALSAQETLKTTNPLIEITALPERLDEQKLITLAQNADVVLDCCDNFATRHAVNRACVATGTPLVSGAAIRFSGQLSVFDLRQPQSPCYHCLFPEGEEVSETRCALMGVFAPLTGLIGSLQAAEALKLIAGIGQSLHAKLWLVDALDMSSRQLRIHRDPACAVCSARSSLRTSPNP